MAAAWPSLRVQLHGNRGTITLENTPPAGDAPAFEKMQVGYIPAGYTLRWLIEDDGDHASTCEITNGEEGYRARTITLTQRPLEADIHFAVENQTTIADAALVQDAWLVIDSPIALTDAQFHQNRTLLWVSGGCYYTARRVGFGDKEEYLKILNSITP